MKGARMKSFTELVVERNELRAQRDELLAALQSARNCLMCCAIDTKGTPSEQTFLDEVHICDAAIWKAEGGKS